MRHFLFPRFIWMTLAACGVLAVGVSVSWAAGLTSLGFVGSDGTITSCVNNTNGSVRFIDPTSKNKNLNSCKPGETQVPVASPPQPQEVTVDCTAGKTGQDITQLIDKVNGDSEVPLTVDIKGTCTGGVSIGRDNVDLQPVSPGAGGISAPSGAPAVFIDDARHVSIQGLQLNGDVSIERESGVLLSDVTISSCQKGLGVSGDSNAQM